MNSFFSSQVHEKVLLSKKPERKKNHFLKYGTPFRKISDIQVIKCLQIVSELSILPDLIH